MQRLKEWPKKYSIVGEVRGRGLMIGIEIVKNRQTREAAGEWRNQIETLAYERGLLVLGCGETSLRLAPPLILRQEEAEIALDILEECIGMVEHRQIPSLAAAHA